MRVRSGRGEAGSQRLAILARANCSRTSRQPSGCAINDLVLSAVVRRVAPMHASHDRACRRSAPKRDNMAETWTERPVPQTLCSMQNLTLACRVYQGMGIFYALGVLYCLIGLAVVCEEYFVASLEALGKRFGLSEDVSGKCFLPLDLFRGSADAFDAAFKATFFVRNPCY